MALALSTVRVTRGYLGNYCCVETDEINRLDSGPLYICSRQLGQDVTQPIDDIKNIVPVMGRGKFPDEGAAAIKRGTGGRSSFNGTVCTVFGGGGQLGGCIVNKLGKVGSQVIIPYRGDPYQVRDLKLCGDLGQILFLVSAIVY